jgi:hypothetical protein
MEKTQVTKEQIQQAILSLPGNERTSLLDWLLEVDRFGWDREIEQDFSSEGAGASMLGRIEKDYRAGRCTKWD